MKHIVIATDGSDGSRAAVEEGTSLARELGAQVTFVYVRHDLPLLGDPLYGERLASQLQHARDALDTATAEAERLGVAYDSDILEGDAVEKIADAVRARAADLLVVGSRGHGGLASAVIGSVSRALLTRSPAPVMVVRERTGSPTAA